MKRKSGCGIFVVGSRGTEKNKFVKQKAEQIKSLIGTFLFLGSRRILAPSLSSVSAFFRDRRLSAFGQKCPEWFRTRQQKNTSAPPSSCAAGNGISGQATKKHMYVQSMLQTTQHSNVSIIGTVVFVWGFGKFLQRTCLFFPLSLFRSGAAIIGFW